MEQRKYLKWYHKVGYGTGDVAGNCVYALLTAFMMIYLTDTVGLSMGIVSTLIALSKIFDGVTDFFFGRMIDKTHTKMGKARPWMLWPYIGCSVALVACFVELLFYAVNKSMQLADVCCACDYEIICDYRNTINIDNFNVFAFFLFESCYGDFYHFF